MDKLGCISLYWKELHGSGVFAGFWRRILAWRPAVSVIASQSRTLRLGLTSVDFFVINPTVSGFGT